MTELECKCMLLLQTQECGSNEAITSPETDIECDIPYADSEGESADSLGGEPDWNAPWCREIIERMLQGGWRLPPPGYDLWTKTWTAEVSTPGTGIGGTTVDPVGCRELGGSAYDLPPRPDVSDTASSSSLMQRLPPSTSTVTSHEL